MFGEYVQMMDQAFKGADEENSREKMLMGGGAKKKQEEALGKGAGKISKVIQETSRLTQGMVLALDEIGVDTYEGMEAELDALIEHVRDVQDPEILSKIDPKKLERAFSLYPEVAKKFEAYMEEITGLKISKEKAEGYETVAPAMDIEAQEAELRGAQRYYQGQR
jgi:hypothetical protein